MATILPGSKSSMFDCLLANLRFRMLLEKVCLDCLFKHTNPNFKIMWNDKSPICREDIKTVGDVRPCYDQDLPQFSQTASVNYLLESHRNAVKNVGLFLKLPCRLELSELQNLDKPLEFPKMTGKKILAWKEMTWFTPLFINSCIFDSFFTHMLLKLFYELSLSPQCCCFKSSVKRIRSAKTLRPLIS